jgi:thioredoxin 2
VPSRVVSPVLERLATELAGRIKLVKVNADDAPGLSTRFEAQAKTTLVLLDQVRVISRQIGAAPAAVLRRWLEEALHGIEG